MAARKPMLSLVTILIVALLPAMVIVARSGKPPIVPPPSPEGMGKSDVWPAAANLAGGLYRRADLGRRLFEVEPLLGVVSSPSGTGPAVEDTGPWLRKAIVPTRSDGLARPAEVQPTHPEVQLPGVVQGVRRADAPPMPR